MGRLSEAVRGDRGRARPLAVVPRVAELLAALVDGRPDATRRAALLDRLRRPGAALETLADSAAVVRELERARRADRARPLRLWPGRRR